MNCLDFVVNQIKGQSLSEKKYGQKSTSPAYFTNYWWEFPPIYTWVYMYLGQRWTD